MCSESQIWPKNFVITLGNALKSSINLNFAFVTKISGLDLWSQELVIRHHTYVLGMKNNVNFKMIMESTNISKETYIRLKSVSLTTFWGQKNGVISKKIYTSLFWIALFCLLKILLIFSLMMIFSAWIGHSMLRNFKD